MGRLLGLGVDSKDLSFLNVTSRGLIVSFASLIIIRCAEKRFLPHKTAFDAILFFMLASILSRAINGSGPFFPSLGVAFVMVGVHRAMAAVTCRFHWLGKLVKGSEAVLVKDGRVLEKNLTQNNLTREDLAEQLRINRNMAGPSGIKGARYERSGEISVVKD